jgi:hypothetical protein
MLQGRLRNRKEDFIYKGMHRFSPVHFCSDKAIKKSPLLTAHFIDYLG